VLADVHGLLGPVPFTVIAWTRALYSDAGDRPTAVKKASPYSITERRVPELIPVLGSQPAGDVSHKPSSKSKVFPYSLPSAGPGADPGVQAVSPQVT